MRKPSSATGNCASDADGNPMGDKNVNPLVCFRCLRFLDGFLWDMDRVGEEASQLQSGDQQPNVAAGLEAPKAQKRTNRLNELSPYVSSFLISLFLSLLLLTSANKQARVPEGSK